MKIRQTIYIDQELMLRVKHQALDENKSISQYITEAVQYKLWQKIKMQKK